MIRGNKKTKSEITNGDTSPGRVYGFSDGVFAIIITIMVLDLKLPQSATFYALFQLWPTWISYCVSYTFIAIVWINHHYLLKYAKLVTLKLIWANFIHLFSVSLIPFLTKWIAETELQSVPVAMYAFVFLLVNVTYLWLVWETLSDRKNPVITRRAWRLLHVRSFITLTLFTSAIITAFWWPFLGFGMICCSLLLYVRPEIPDTKI
jgi:uncharacterized membrane protein